MFPLKTPANKLQESNRLNTGAVVEYQQHGKSIIGIILSAQKDKWQIINENNSEVYLPSTRLAILGFPDDESPNNHSKVTFLKQLSNEANSICSSLNLGELWELVVEEQKIITEQELLEIAFPAFKIAHKLAVRRALLDDIVFFKRDKSGLSFEPRRHEVVEELKQKAVVEKAKEKERERLIDAIISKRNNPDAKLPESITLIEKLAALGSKAPQAKETLALIEAIAERYPDLNLQGKQEDKAFQLLVAIGHFATEENLALYRMGRSPRFSSDLEAEALSLGVESKYVLAANIQDLTTHLIFSIDSATTKDIDDALSLEETPQGYRLGIHITDVASTVEINSPMFREALMRATSIYCPDQQIPMLPEILSADKLSLVEGQKRWALTFFIDIDSENKILKREVVRSLIAVTHRLSYEEVEEFLYNESGQAKLRSSELENAILKLYDISSWLETARIEAGAMQFLRREMLPVINSDGTITLEQNSDDTPARKLVSELMILANETAALFARDNYIPFIYRSQEAPEVEPSTQALHIPEGPARDFLQRAGLKRSIASTQALRHFGLGLQAYTQITSPIRRASDLVNQHQILSFLNSGKCRFSNEEVSSIINQLEEKLDEAFEIQRDRNRYWLLKYLIQEKYKEIEGTVMKTDSMRPLAELDKLFVMWPYDPQKSKRIAPYQITTRPGERVKLRIEKIDPKSLTLRLVEM